MNTATLRAGIDVGGIRHRIAVRLPAGKLIDELTLTITQSIKQADTPFIGFLLSATKALHSFSLSG